MAILIRGQRFKDEKEAGAFLGIDPVIIRCELTGPLENRFYCDESDSFSEEPVLEAKPGEQAKPSKIQLIRGPKN